MIVQERRPGLARPPWRAHLAHVFLDGPLGDADVQLEQLAADALGAPRPVGARYLLDQRDRLRRDARATSRGDALRATTPEEAEEVAMPAQQGVGLHDDEGLPP